jgi:hypothetical protein
LLSESVKQLPPPVIESPVPMVWVPPVDAEGQKDIPLNVHFGFQSRGFSTPSKAHLPARSLHLPGAPET